MLGQHFLSDEHLALRMEIAQRPALEAELARVREFEAGNAGFLPETNRQLATAALVQRLESVVGAASPQPGRCQITARTPSDARTDEPFVRASVQVRLRCGNAETLGVLHALESARPYLFVDVVNIAAQRYFAIPGNNLPQEGGLDVSFDLCGYLRPAPAAANGEAPRG